MGCGASGPQPIAQQGNGADKSGAYPQQQLTHAVPQQQPIRQLQPVQIQEPQQQPNPPPQQPAPPQPIMFAPPQQPAPPQQQQNAPPQQPAPPQQQPNALHQQPAPPQQLQNAPPQQPAHPQQQEIDDKPTESVNGGTQDVPKTEDVVPPTDNNENEKDVVTVTAETLKQFMEYETSIRRIERNKAEENLVMGQTQLANLQTALKNAEAELARLRANTEKEKQDVDQFDIPNFMFQNEAALLSIGEARQNELQEYLAAKNQQHVAEQQVERLRNQMNAISNELEKNRAEVLTLNDLKTKIDGLLENIFNGQYGSDLEERLEIEAEQLLQYKQHVSVAHYKWHNSITLIHSACLQLAYAKRRWEQMQEVDPQHIQAKYQMLAEVRGNLIASHQNIERTREYLHINLAYFSVEDSQNLIGSINSIVVDVITLPSYQKALEWYKYYHYRSALLLNWMDQIIKNKIIKDHQDVSRRFHDKYNELKAERLRCIKERVRGNVGADLDTFDDTNEEVQLDINASETKIAFITAEDHVVSNNADGDADRPPPPVEPENGPMTLPEPPKQTESGPPVVAAMPLSDLAPPPSSEELFGNIAELKELHKTQLADFEKAQTVNKARLDQGLEDKLRARKSKRRRQKLHEDQTKVLANKYENALAVEANDIAAEEIPLGGDGNPEAIKAPVVEETVVAAEETPLGGDGNPDVIKPPVVEETLVAAEETPLGGDGNPDVLNS